MTLGIAKRISLVRVLIYFFLPRNLRCLWWRIYILQHNTMPWWWIIQYNYTIHALGYKWLLSWTDINLVNINVVFREGINGQWAKDTKMILLIIPDMFIILWCVARSSFWGKISMFSNYVDLVYIVQDPGFPGSCVKDPGCWSHDCLISMTTSPAHCVVI